MDESSPAQSQRLPAGGGEKDDDCRGDAIWGWVGRNHVVSVIWITNRIGPVLFQNDLASRRFDKSFFTFQNGSREGIANVSRQYLV